MITVAMSSMQKDVHEKTAEKECKREIWSKMLSMIDKNIPSREDEKRNENPANGIFHRGIIPLRCSFDRKQS